jgi:hypothetical protein
VNPTDLLVIVPSRARPHRVPLLAQAWVDTGATAKLLLCIDLDDPAIGQYMDACEDHGVELLVASLRRPSMTINEVACRYANSWTAIGFCRDDFAPDLYGWDHVLLSELGSSADGSVAGTFGPDSPTIVVTSSAAVAEVGYLVTPEQWQAYVETGRLS